jgi:GNAT superfamily N-acetyltransferase
MENYKIREIENLPKDEIMKLVIESQNDGFQFLNRLVRDYENGTNMFDKPGEALFGVFDKRNELIAIGGINIDPFTKEDNIGRLRRFYVAKTYRRKGIGRMLVKQILDTAIINFQTIVLHTDTEQADKFYQSLGFKKTDRYPKSTHYLRLPVHLL